MAPFDIAQRFRDMVKKRELISTDRSQMLLPQSMANPNYTGPKPLQPMDVTRFKDLPSLTDIRAKWGWSPVAQNAIDTLSGNLGDNEPPTKMTTQNPYLAELMRAKQGADMQSLQQQSMGQPQQGGYRGAGGLPLDTSAFMPKEPGSIQMGDFEKGQARVNFVDPYTGAMSRDWPSTPENQDLVGRMKNSFGAESLRQELERKNQASALDPKAVSRAFSQNREDRIAGNQETQTNLAIGREARNRAFKASQYDPDFLSSGFKDRMELLDKRAAEEEAKIRGTQPQTTTGQLPNPEEVLAFSREKRAEGLSMEQIAPLLDEAFPGWKQLPAD